MFRIGKMYRQVFALLVLGAVWQLTESAEMLFTDCGNGEMKSITIEPCEAQPCHFDRGDQANLTFFFETVEPTEKVTIRSTLRTGGLFDFEINIPDEDHRVCQIGDVDKDFGKIKCPTEKGQLQSYVATRKFPGSTAFNIFRYSKIKFYNENNKVIACGLVRLQFQRYF